MNKLITLLMPLDAKRGTAIFMIALTVWREASGESKEAKQAVACVIRNRVQKPGWWGKDWCEIVAKRAQFASMTVPGDPNLVRWPSPDDTSWLDALVAACNVVTGAIEDPTQGATFYFDKSLDSNPPKWAAQYAHTADVGNFHFYKEK